jgi:uroporphyrinogen-III synthase
MRMAFDGRRVLALESRRSEEIATLIRKQGGDPFVAPSMREAPLDGNQSAFDFAERLFAGGFDMVILLTGVGTRVLDKALAGRYGEGRFAEALRGVTVVARGPKPMAALREMGVTGAIAVPEPNTWRELLQTIEGRSEKRIAVQEYGRPAEELMRGLRERGAEVTPVRIYEWAMPEDTGPLREAVNQLAAARFDFALFTTSVQVEHLMRVAGEQGVEEAVLRNLQKYTVVASIGPSCSEMLDEYRIPTDIAPTHPKMGFLVKETADRAADLIAKKRSAPERVQRGIMQQYGRYLSLGMALPVATFVGYAIGYLLDRALHTSFLSIVFLILGIASGFVQIVREVNRDNRDA